MLFTPRKCWNLLKYKIIEKWTSSCSLWTQRLQTQVEKKVGERIRGCQPLYLCWPFFRWKSKYKRVDSSSSSLLLEAGGIRKALVFICVAFPSAALGRSPPPILPRPFPTRVLLLSISLSLFLTPLYTQRSPSPFCNVIIILLVERLKVLVLFSWNVKHPILAKHWIKVIFFNWTVLYRTFYIHTSLLSEYPSFGNFLVWKYAGYSCWNINKKSIRLQDSWCPPLQFVNFFIRIRY